MRTLRLPTRQECFELLHEYKVPQNIFEHSLVVNKVAVFLAKKLKEKGENVNVELVDRASLLHDLDKKDTLKQSNHGEITEKILAEKGYPEVGEVCKYHRLQYSYLMDKLSWECRIVNYADSRVMHDKIVSWQERLQDLTERYEVKKPDKSIPGFWAKLEKDIFDKIKLNPDDLQKNIYSIKAIIFDFGDVLTIPGVTLKAFSKFQHHFSEPIEEVLKNTWGADSLLRLMRGHISFNEFAEKLAETHGIQPEVQHQIQAYLEELTELNQEVMEIVKQLKGRYMLAILSDHIDGVFQKYVEKFSLNNYFETIVCSANEGYLKADAELFKILLKKLHLEPEQCIMIDDRKVNIKVAQQLGFHTIHFMDAPKLKNELRNKGMQIQ
ncbi:HAD-IA family hydrolase [Candidatus Woesearchaeota archaeon]|nr:HAD-IA family hydrolase [Candidatus Woesearchaeota archaeon]